MQEARCFCAQLFWWCVCCFHWPASFLSSLCKQGKVKLAKFGLYYMTDHGADVDFPIGWAPFSPVMLLHTSHTHYVFFPNQSVSFFFFFKTPSSQVFRNADQILFRFPLFKKEKLEGIFKIQLLMHHSSDLEHQHFMKEKINEMCGAPIMKQDELIWDVCHHSPSSFWSNPGLGFQSELPHGQS